jgi:hypothetical protein
VRLSVNGNTNSSFFAGDTTLKSYKFLIAISFATLAFSPTAKSAPPVHGVLTYEAGKRFETVVYEPQLLGILPAAGKEPFLVFSGLGCDECDINRSIYIHSPSDPAMESGEIGARYSNPGEYYDYESQELVETVRMFLGRCITEKEVSVIWFSNTKLEGGQWRESTFVAKVEGQALVDEFSNDNAISLAAILQAASKQACQEVPGMKFSIEP